MPCVPSLASSRSSSLTEWLAYRCCYHISAACCLDSVCAVLVVCSCTSIHSVLVTGIDRTSEVASRGPCLWFLQCYVGEDLEHSPIWQLKGLIVLLQPSSCMEQGPNHNTQCRACTSLLTVMKE